MANREKADKCAECLCDLTLFTGMHIMTNGKRQKTVCGICASQLEIKGWKAVVKTK